MAIIGKQSVSFEVAPYIFASASVVGKKENEGPLGPMADRVFMDDMCGCDNWEEAESVLQKSVVEELMRKTSVAIDDIRYIFSGDLLGQLIATSFGVMDYERPLFGLYGACSTFGEAMSLGAMCVAGGFAKNVIAMASSHFGSAEKTFRFPLAYGNQRPLAATYTVTGSGAVIISNIKGSTSVRITGITTGKVVDYGVKDSMNMGACMAPAAADTIACHLSDFGLTSCHYDKVITGDLGSVGHTILCELLMAKGIDITKRHIDCGTEIFTEDMQDINSGGSGCGCSAVTFCTLILSQMEKEKWKRVLFVPTGALLSPVSFNEGKSVPGIAHAIALEYV